MLLRCALLDSLFPLKVDITKDPILSNEDAVVSPAKGLSIKQGRYCCINKKQRIKYVSPMTLQFKIPLSKWKDSPVESLDNGL